MRHRRERHGHRRRSFARRNHVERPARDDVGDVRIANGAIDHTASADRLDTGASYFEKIVFELGNGNRQ